MILFKAFQNKHLQSKDLTFCPSNYNQQTQSFQLILEKYIYNYYIIFKNDLMITKIG